MYRNSHLRIFFGHSTLFKFAQTPHANVKKHVKAGYVVKRCDYKPPLRSKCSKKKYYNISIFLKHF